MLRADAVDDRENQGTPKPKEQYNTVACTVKIPERRRLPRPSCVVVESASSTGCTLPGACARMQTHFSSAMAHYPSQLAHFADYHKF